MIIKHWTFSNSEYIYIQFARKIKYAIYNKDFSTGETIPSIRRTAQILHINPNTASRAYNLVKNEGLIVVSKSGNYSVITNEQFIAQKRNEEVSKLCCPFLQNMSALGFGKMETIQYLQAFIANDKDCN